MRLLRICWFRPLLALGAFCAAGLTEPELAAQTGSGWHLGGGQAPIINLKKGRLPKLAPQPKTASGGGAVAMRLASTAPIAPEIIEVAKALGDDPLAIFNWVRNKIDYIHYRGAKKGALMTLIERSGNDYDQSLLLRDLLKAAGSGNAGNGSLPQITNVKLSYGENFIPYDDVLNGRDIRHWLGVPAAAVGNTHADQLLLNRGTLGSEASKNSGGMWLLRVWVTASVNNQQYHFDPSFKKYEEVTGINIGTVAGYQPSSAMTALGGTVGDGNLSFIGANETAFGTYLKERTTALATDLKLATHAFKDPGDVTGGWRLTEWTAGSLADAYPLGAPSLYWVWDEVPSDRVVNLKLTLGDGAGALVHEMPWADLDGRRLTLEFAKSGANTKAQIWLDDTMVLEEPAFVAGGTVNLKIRIDHPTAPLGTPDPTDPTLTQLDQQFTQSYKRTVTQNGMPNGTPIYVLAYGCDVSQESLRSRERKLEDYKAAGKADNSREVMGETLNVIGQQWYLQTELTTGILTGIKGCAPCLHHRIGRVAQEEGVYIDVMGQFDGTVSRTGNWAAAGSVFTTSSFVWSAMEHGVLDQLQNYAAASTVALISRANALGHKSFLVSNATQFTAIQSQLTGYSAAQITELQTRLSAAGTQLVVPGNGALRLSPTDAWIGTGYVAASASSIGMIISGGYNGGYGTLKIPVIPNNVRLNTNSSGLIITQQPVTVLRGLTWDPVDLVSGQFVLSSTDLAVGPSLSFSRSYDGALRNKNDAGMGFGWRHSGYLRLSERTSVENALGLRSPLDMAASLVGLTAMLDLYDSRNTVPADAPKKWFGSLMAAKWVVERLKNNSVSVQTPDSNMEFTRQPDETYTPPPGITAALAKNTTTNRYTVTPRNGGPITFEAVVPASTGNYRLKETEDLWARKHIYAYDGTGRLTTITDPYARSLTLTYASDRISAVSDSTGRSVSYTYDANGNLTEYTDPEGKKDRYVYDASHRITETKDHTNRTSVKNFYDDRHRVVEQHNKGLSTHDYLYAYAPGITRETDPKGNVTRHLFDELSRGIGSINAIGIRHRIGYDARNHKVEEVTESGAPVLQKVTWLYDHHDNLKEIKNHATNATVLLNYDAQHRLLNQTAPGNRLTSFTYNTKHQVASTTDPHNQTTFTLYSGTTGFLNEVRNHVFHSTFYEYDTLGQLKKVIYPDNNFSEQSVTARGDVEWTKDPRGIRTDYTYNLRRELTSTTQGGRRTMVEYDDNRMAWRSTNARGFSTTTTYSVSGKPITTTAPDGASSTTLYEERDLAYSVTDPLGAITQTTLDALSRPHVTTDPLQRQVTTLYDNDGRVQTVQAPLSRNSLTTYSFNTTTGDSLTTVDQEVDTGIPGISSKKTDIKGELRQVTNRKGKVYNLSYNALGQLISTIQPGGRTRWASYGWNNIGEIQINYEPSGHYLNHQMDNRGRLKTRTGPDATTQFGYDASGNLLTVTEGAAVITRTYETTRDALSTYTNAAGDVIGYTYDANGNLSTLTYPGGKVVQYAYDSRDRLRRVTDWAGRATTFEYDAAGRLREIRRPNGTVRRTEYDAAGQMVSLVEVGPTGQLVTLQSWRYDLGGRPAQRLRSPAPAAFASPGFTATHHDDNRLATLTPQGGASTTVTSDPDGNITSVPLWEGNQAWTGTSLTWDARNRLQTVSQPALVSYGYDAEGNLINRTQGASVTRYTVNPGAALSQTLITHHADGAKTFYVHGAGLLYEEKFSGGGASLGTRSYHYDQVGSTMALSNGSGVVTGRLEYTAYGLTSHTSGVVDTVFRYNGQYGVMTDPSTGLLNMRARWYSPALGRFLSEDPIGFSGGMNWYAYADGDPLMRVDPSGLESFMFPPQYAQSAEFRAGFDSAANHPVIQGFVLGATGAVVVTAAAPVVVSGFVMAGMSSSSASAVVTFGLGASAAVGGAATILDTTAAVRANDWDRVAFNLAGVAGGAVVGVAGGGRYLADNVSPAPSSVPKSAGLFGDNYMHYQSGKGSLIEWFGTGPTPQSGGGAATAIASGGATVHNLATRGVPRSQTMTVQNFSTQGVPRSQTNRAK